MNSALIQGIFLAFCLAAMVSCTAGPPAGEGEGPALEPIVFATFAEEPGQLDNIHVLVKSIRRFAGAFRNAPIRLYVSEDLAARQGEALKSLAGLGVEITKSRAPSDAKWFYYSSKVFAAAKAEYDAERTARFLAWVDDDTVFLDEPDEFILPEGAVLGYRPVMHRNIGSLFDEEIDPFWDRAFAMMAVAPESLFPMTTPADGEKIRPYFNAGCLILRPGRGVLREWPLDFKLLYRDPDLAAMCREDIKKRIFLHQAALTGAILNRLDRDEMVELSARFNYPIFFEQMFGANRVFDDITGVVTFRHESYFRNPHPDWEARLKGPADRIAWLKEHLLKE